MEEKNPVIITFDLPKLFQLQAMDTGEGRNDTNSLGRNATNMTDTSRKISAIRDNSHTVIEDKGAMSTLKYVRNKLSTPQASKSLVTNPV